LLVDPKNKTAYEFEQKLFDWPRKIGYNGSVFWEILKPVLALLWQEGIRARINFVP